MGTTVDRLMEHHMWIFAVWLIPLSLVYDLIIFLNRCLDFFFFYFSLKRTFDKGKCHGERVAIVQRQVRDWICSGSGRQMCTARPQWKSITVQRLVYKERLHKIDIGQLSNIVSVDAENRSVRVEPMISIGKLNDFLICRGWMLPVVPELDDLTVGGLVMGGGIESTSHKYGLFQYICKRFELVMADASCIWCSKVSSGQCLVIFAHLNFFLRALRTTSQDEEPELFCAVPFSYGTLGFLTAVDLDMYETAGSKSALIILAHMVSSSRVFGTRISGSLTSPT